VTIQLKKSSKTNFSLCERHRWAVGGKHEYLAGCTSYCLQVEKNGGKNLAWVTFSQFKIESRID